MFVRGSSTNIAAAFVQDVKGQLVSGIWTSSVLRKSKVPPNPSKSCVSTVSKPGKHPRNCAGVTFPRLRGFADWVF